MAGSLSKNDTNQQFVYIANELNARFPELDLRFNLKSGSNQLRYRAAAVSRKVHMLTLGTKKPSDLVYQACFTLKEITRQFDA